MEKENTVINRLFPDEKIVDHKGNRYRSIQKLCDTYGVKPNTFYRRVNAGRTVQEALENERLATRTKNSVLIGENWYPSLAAACKANGNVCIASVRSYMKKNKMAAEEAINMAKKNKHSPIKSFDGRCFKSEKYLCKAYHINIRTYKERLSAGMSQEEALTTRRTTNGKTISTLNGKEFGSIAAFCHYLGEKDTSNTRRWTAAGYPAEVAICMMRSGRIRDNKTRIYYDSEDDMCAAFNIKKEDVYNVLRNQLMTFVDALYFVLSSNCKEPDFLTDDAVQTHAGKTVEM